MVSIVLTQALATGGPNAWYTQYQHYGLFADLAATLRGRLTGAQKILVAGCGFGYDVAELQAVAIAGTTVWGCDAAQYAIDQAKLQQSALAAQYLRADVTVAADIAAVKTAMGVQSAQPIPLIITDDLLSCATSEAEVQNMLAALRSASARLIHVLSLLADGANHGGQQVTTTGGAPVPGKLWRTAAQWKASINAPSDVLVDAGLHVEA